MPKPARKTTEKRTEVLRGAEKAIKRGVEFMSNAREKMDICYDSRGPSIVVNVDAYRKGYRGLRERGGTIRAITDITSDNVQYCKKLIDMVDALRHLDGLKGGIAVTESEYMATTVLEEAKPLAEVIYSNVPEMVRQGQYIFDSFWERSIPAEDRILELEQGIQPEFVKTLRDPTRIQNLGYELLARARAEVRIMFSTTNSFHRQEHALKMLTDIIRDKDVTVRILTPFDSEIRSRTEELGDAKGRPRLVIRELHPGSYTTMSILMIDSTYSLAVEVRDDTKKTSIEAIGFATYSNSSATVNTYISIFETLWKQVQLYQQLQTHDKMQQEFINVAAHEFRSPLQPIIGLSEILYSRIEGGHNKELVRIMIRNAERLQQLAENVLDVARIESNLLKMHKELLNVNEVVRGVALDVENSTRRRIKTSLAPDKDAFVLADRAKISQVLFNLLENSLKFTRKGRITIETQASVNQVSVNVVDSGSGIDPEVLPRLFTKFATKSEKGIGLGLYIAKGIIESHGGQIRAENNPERPGATFSFCLPRSQ